MTHLRGEEPEPYRLTTTGLLEVDDSFYEAYMLVFPSRLPLVKRCIRALELEAPPAVSCPTGGRKYVEINRCRVYFEGTR